MEMKINSGEGKPDCHKPKPGGVIPAERRSVKSLILDDILQCFRSLLSGPTSSTAASPSAGVLADDGDKAKASSAKKIMCWKNKADLWDERPASSSLFGVDCGSGSSPNNEIYELRRKKKAASAESTFLYISLCLEILSIAFDQASSPSKPHYALFGMLLAIVGVLICVLEFIYKGIKGRVELRRWGKLWWFYYPPPPCYKPLGTVVEIYGLVSGIAQCVSSIIQYVYFSQHLDSPIKFSPLPAILVICLITSRLSKDQMRIRDGAGGRSL